MDIKLLSLYFLLGGAVITLVTYFGSQGKGLLAAFVACFPSVTIVTLCTIYLNGGAGAAVSYFRGMLLLIPAWLLYTVAIVFLLPRLGLVPSLLVGVFLYATSSLLIMKLGNY